MGAAAEDSAGAAPLSLTDTARLLAGVKPEAPDRVEKLKDFSRRFMEAAFRRPLTGDYRAIIEKQFTASKTPEVAVKRVVLFTLKSPRFPATFAAKCG